MRKKYTGSEVLLAVIFGFIVSPIMNGFVVSKLWLWFVVTTFEVPTLSIPVAIGLGITARLLINGFNANNKADTDENVITTIVAHALFSPLIVLLIGWVVTLFM